jgi:hypothetical protein
MGIQRDALNGSSFATWLRQHKKSVAILGALIVIATYMCKEIVQTGLQEKIQDVQRWRMEAHLDGRLDRLEPNLREELSNGSDPKKRFTDQAATLFLKSGEYPPGAGKSSVPFATVIDMECGQDDPCLIAEWYRYRGTLERQLVGNSRIMEVVGKPGPFNLERIALARIDEKLVKAKKREQSAFANLTKKGADENLIPPTHNDVEEFTSAVNAMEGVTNEQTVEMMIYVPDVVSRLRRNLRITSVLSGVLFLVGWMLSLLGLMYDLGLPDPDRAMSNP